MLAVAVEAFWDLVEVRACPGSGRIEVQAEGPVPSSRENVAFAVAEALLAARPSEVDLFVHVRKGVPVGRGLGSSAATAAATAVAVAALLAPDAGLEALLKAGGAGEAAAAGEAHMDNLAASLVGGFALYDHQKGRVLRIEPPESLVLGILMPDVQFAGGKTKFMRSLVPRQVSIEDHVRQSSALAKAILALRNGDVKSFGEAVNFDAIAEPGRAPHIPLYSRAKGLALELGAYGFNIAGAGPSTFFVHDDPRRAEEIGRELVKLYEEEGYRATFVLTRPSKRGAHVVGP